MQSTKPIIPIEQSDPKTNPLFGHDLIARIKQSVSHHLGRAWHTSGVFDLKDFACHPAAILTDQKFGVFAKYSDAPDAARQFASEVSRLRYLADYAHVAVPTVIEIVPADHGYIFISEALPERERTSSDWRDIGRMLATIHAITSDKFGFDSNNYFGPYPQDNTWTDDWPTFYAERRLLPMLKLAIDSGHLPTPLARQVELIVSKLPELCGPSVRPTLVHGDAQQNNFVSTPSGTYVIDPALYFGHPEIDLAWVDHFQPVPADVLDSYRELIPIDPGFAERRDLWRIYGYLAGVAAEGEAYVKKLQAAMKRYV
jgi:fructosamine-3-kinase